MSFPLAGNERVAGTVLSAIAARRIPHAVLLEGEPGLGRHTLARYIAMAAVCTGANPPCGECRDCHLAENASHPDISVTAPEDKKKNIAVSQIRALRQEAYVRPHTAAHRVFIVDKADTMNEQSQNALLKVLEEPPGGVIFILIAESRAALLTTIISRCTLLTLAVPELAQGTAFLAGRGFEETAARAALESANNNIGRALELLTQKKSNKAVQAARDFWEMMFTGSEFDLLSLTAGLEKDRAGADIFLGELKMLTARGVRERHRDTAHTRALLAFYKELEQLEPALQTNISLPLLFCAMVSRVKEIILI